MDGRYRLTVRLLPQASDNPAGAMVIGNALV